MKTTVTFRTTRSILAICTAAALAACAGGATLPQAPPSPALRGAPTGAPHEMQARARRRPGKIALSIHIPKRQHGHAIRVLRDGKPLYISPSTQGMTVAITGPTNLTETVGLLPSSPGCSSSLAGTFCTLLVSGLQPCVPVSNCYTATIATYDAVACTPGCSIPGRANELSSAQNVTFSVATGQTNAVNLTLGGIPVSLSATPLKRGFLQGDAHALHLWGPSAQTLVVEARDADGNAIVGPGAPAITGLASAATLSVTNPSAAAPNLVTLQAATSGAPATITPGTFRLQLSAVPAPQSGGTTISQTVPITIAHSVLYVAFLNAVEAFYDGNTGSPSVNIVGPSTGFDGVGGLALDGNGTLYAPNLAFFTVGEFAAGADGDASPNATISGGSTGLSQPRGSAIDSSGTLYVANGGGSGSITEYPPGVSGDSSPSATIAGDATGMNTPLGLALDANRTIYVSNYGGNTITEYPAGTTGNATPSVTISGTGIREPWGIAIDTNGTLYVANYGYPGSITEYAPGASGDAAPIATIEGASTNIAVPDGVAVDANGTIYVANNSGGINEYAAGANGNVAPIASIPLTYAPMGIAVVPASSSL